MKFFKSSCHRPINNNNKKGPLIGFFLSLITILWHLVHCALPIIMPVLILLNIPMPTFLHQIKIPFIFTLISILWIIYYLLHKRIIIFWSFPFLIKHNSTNNFWRKQ